MSAGDTTRKTFKALRAKTGTGFLLHKNNLKIKQLAEFINQLVIPVVESANELPIYDLIHGEATHHLTLEGT